MVFWAGRGRLQDLALPPASIEKLERFLDLLEEWSSVCNLKGELTGDEVVRDHLLESLVGADWLLPGKLVDVGSGNGFPAVPLLVAREDVSGVLLEPRARRWAFLKEVVRTLELPAKVVRWRLQEANGLEARNVSVRGVAREVWEGSLASLVGKGGRVLWWAGPRASWRPPPGFEDVITCPLPNPERGCLVIWGRCST